jgi:hypothetical protein
MAIEFIDLLSADHHAMDDEFYKRMGEHFTAAQIIELGFTCASAMGLHRFIHTLDVYGDSPPVIGYSPDQIDTRKHRSCERLQCDRWSHSVMITSICWIDAR